MNFLVNVYTPDNAPEAGKMDPLGPGGMFLGKPMRFSAPEVLVQVRSVRHIPDFWWVGPYLTISDRVLQVTKESGETHFETFPFVATKRKSNEQQRRHFINLLDNVACL